MQTHTHRKTMRMPTQIADAMEYICSKYKIKESEYMRKALMERIQNDLENTKDENNKYIFI